MKHKKKAVQAVFQRAFFREKLLKLSVKLVEILNLTNFVISRKMSFRQLFLLLKFLFPGKTNRQKQPKSKKGQNFHP